MVGAFKISENFVTKVSQVEMAPCIFNTMHISDSSQYGRKEMNLNILIVSPKDYVLVIQST